MSVNRDLKVAMEGHKTTSAGGLFHTLIAAGKLYIDGPGCGWNLEFMTMSSGADNKLKKDKSKATGMADRIKPWTFVNRCRDCTSDERCIGSSPAVIFQL